MDHICIRLIDLLVFKSRIRWTEHVARIKTKKLLEISVWLLKERGQSKYLGVDGRKILKLVLGKWNRMYECELVLAGLSYVLVTTSFNMVVNLLIRGLCWSRICTSFVHPSLLTSNKFSNQNFTCITYYHYPNCMPTPSYLLRFNYSNKYMWRDIFLVT
jgi:hypothetical protein